jgi:Fe-S-cluster containining protein
MLITNLAQIETIATHKEAENIQFKDYLKSIDTNVIDRLVLQLVQQIEPQIDCTQCGNCCKTLMINVTKTEADHLALYLEQSRIEFDEKYLEKSTNGMIFINTIPCHFLKNNKCTIYNYRFEGCREFPGLHLPKFTQRLFTIFMHYNRCPIVFNVIEELKLTTNF